MMTGQRATGRFRTSNVEDWKKIERNHKRTGGLVWLRNVLKTLPL